MIYSLLRRLGKACLDFALLTVPLAALAGPPGLLDNEHPAVRAVMAAQEAVTDQWMQEPEILGTAVGIDAGGMPVLRAYIDRDAGNAGEVIRNLPREVQGQRVDIE